MEHAAKHFQKRSAILKCLQSTDTHPSAEWIYQRLKEENSDISLATVYRNLALFKQQGLVQSLGTVNGAERFDGETCPHVHFICTQCGCVQDLAGITPPQELRTAAAGLVGGTVHGCQLSFTGRCSHCSPENQN